jgi:CBS domain-containing protein
MPTITPRAVARPLLELTAADLMTTPVRTIPQEMSLREAAHLLVREKISGAPVVDANGHCQGVLSSSDFVTWAGQDGNGEVIHFIAPWGEMIDIDDSPDDEIRHYMTARPISVSAKAKLGELAGKMVDVHIHRVLVVTDQNRPQGIVTSTDILAAVSRAAERTAPPGEKKVKRGSRAPRQI